ncbi:hypothetical protein CC117_25785 [Parafrankia colletiae]|uniref:Uncharacterized protein n=1 Tax=Parafrankia colletiae TaxID=573497 RepID=A0A1S1Q9U6_9ACTN|nr:hypothetical protein [Parafrankia colletiae]MCK9903602.1 hypothetical protein [Frankia sp. Cpl3]OHV31628.1 hypothetical protein CC117_25785 [Parafrankia colletiae]
MDLTRLRVAVRPHADDPHRAERPEFSVPYLPDGCPAAEPRWSPIDGVYSPHQGTVCPDCLPRWRRDADISAPYPNLLPSGNPLVILLEPAPTPARGVSLDLATCLDEAGFTRAGWLPLPGLADTFVWDHPADQTRVILHAFGVEFHLRHPGTGQRFHTHLGRRFSPARLRHLLAAGGYRPDTDSVPHPAPPPEGWALDSDETALLITIADHPDAARGSLVLDAALAEALHAGWITAVAMPDGSLVFAFRSQR